jgi:DNA-binding helix-hairpin-helix protein with protein kinase domain
MSLIVSDPTGIQVQLSEHPLAQGGEAAVYTVARHPNVVVKLYHDRVLQGRRDTLKKKIDALCEATFDPFKKHDALSWPRFPVFDDQGRWRGYAMRRAKGVSMNRLAHAMAYREHFPKLTRADIVSYLISLVEVVELLHARGVLIGDYNLQNFLCDPNSHAVALIDCDSWQVTTDSKTFRCAVAAPDMLAPELHGKQLAMVNRTLESEYFSLAIVLFKALMLGRHPYDVVGGEGPVENIRRGYCPYGIGGGGIPKGPWYNIWSHLPYSIKEQFCTTFKEGVNDPSKRTTTAQWKELLVRYRREIVDKKWHSNEIRPAEPKKKDYRGTKSISQPCVN